MQPHTSYAHSSCTMNNINYTRAEIRREMDRHCGPPPDDPSRNIVECKVWPKQAELPDCHCGLRSVPKVSRVHCTFGQRYWICPKINDVANPQDASQVTGVVIIYFPNITVN